MFNDLHFDNNDDRMQTEIQMDDKYGLVDRLAFLDLDNKEEAKDGNVIKEEVKNESDEDDDQFFDMIKKKNKTHADGVKNIMKKLGNFIQKSMLLDINENLQNDNNSEMNFDETEDMANFEIDLTSNLHDL